MDVAKDLELERINGAYGPDYLKRLEDNQKNIDRVNTFAAGIIGARVDAGAVIDMTEEQRTRDTAFIPITIEGVTDNGELAEDAVYAIGGLKGYKIGYDKTKGVRITRPGDGDAYISIDDWNAISGNLYYHRKDNTTTDMQGLTQDSFYDKDINGQDVLKPSLITTTASGIGTANEIPGTPIEPTPGGINADGYYTFRQNFNTQAVENIKTKVLESTFEKLESFGPYAYKQELWLKDLERSGFDRVAYNNIGSADYREANPDATEADIKKAKKQYLIDSAEAQFLSIAQIKKDGNNGYYREIQGRKATKADLGSSGSISAANLMTNLGQSITAYEGEESGYGSAVASGLNNLFGFSESRGQGLKYRLTTTQSRPYRDLEFTFEGKYPGQLQLVASTGDAFEPLTAGGTLDKNAKYIKITSANQLANYLSNNVKGLAPSQKLKIIKQIKDSYGENFFKGQAPTSN